MSLIDNPARATIELLSKEVHENFIAGTPNATGQGNRQTSLWISPTPVTIRLRIFCLPYAGGVSANVFSR